MPKVVASKNFKSNMTPKVVKATENFRVSDKYLEKGIQKRSEIGFDTLSSDIASLGKTVKSIYNGWQSKKTMDSTKPQVESMYNRLKALQSYNSQFGDGSVDVSEQINAYKSVLDEWDKIAESYGKYKNADEYNKAIVKETKKSEERTWFKKSKGGFWETVGGTIADVGENLIKGISEMPEKLLDAGLTLGALQNQSTMNQAAESEIIYNAVSGKKEGAKKTLKRYEDTQDDVEKETAKFVAKDIIKTDKIDFGVDDYSVLGEKSDSLVQSGGQLLAQLGANALMPGSGLLMMGATSFGSEAENAFNQGATFDEAVLSSTITAGAEMLSEKLGGISFGGKTVTDAIFAKMSSKMISKLAKVLITTGKITTDAVFEGGEELFSGYMGAIGQKLTYMEDKEIEELFSNDDALESFIGGVVLGGLGGTGEALVKGKGYVTGLNKSEQKVVDRLYNDAIAEAEKDGKKLTIREKTKIFDGIVEQFENKAKGDAIDTDSQPTTNAISQPLEESVQKTNARKAAEQEVARATEYKEMGIDTDFERMKTQIENGGTATAKTQFDERYYIQKKSDGTYVAIVEGEGSGGFVQNELNKECDTFEEAFISAWEYIYERNPDLYSKTISYAVEDYDSAHNNAVYNTELHLGDDGDIINNNRIDNEEENKNGSTDTELLERREVSTADRSRNSIRQHGANTEIIRGELGNLHRNKGINDNDVAAGETGWISKRNFESAQKMGSGLEESFLGSVRGTKSNGYDSIGRKLNEEIQERVSETVFKDQDGTVFSFFHWTPYSFDDFKYGDGAFHCGTLIAALTTKQRSEKKVDGTIKEMYVISKNPIILKDEGSFGPYNVGQQLEKFGIISHDEFIKISEMDGFYSDRYDTEACQYVRNLLKSLGYDSYLYQNMNEDTGSWSVGVFDADQIITIAENGILKENCGVTQSHIGDSDADYELSDNDQYAKDKSFWTAENKNDTTVSKSLKDKLASLFGKKNDKKTVSISEIVKLIEKEFNIPVSKGKFREKAYGIYKNHSQAIRTKISNALPTIAHELGHHLDNKYGLRYFESIGEAERILKETRPDFYNAYKPEARPREAVAEFIRDYLADRKMAKDKYPFFFEEFERRLSENGKTDLENLKAIGDKINEYYSAELRDRAKSAIISRREAKKLKRMEVKLNDVLTRAETEILDDGAAFKEISDEAYDLYYWAKKSSVRAKNTLTGYYMSGFDEDIVRQRDKDGNVMKDENGNEIYVPALKHILSEIENGTMFDDFNEYLVCRHGIEWLNHDLRVFADDALNTKSYMTERLKNLENQYPQFKETAENLYGWYKTFVYEYGVKSGLMTKEQYKALTEKYPCYVPFMRNMEGKKSGHTKSGVANQNAPIKRAKGSGLEIYSPIESLVIKVEQFMKAADRNAVMQKIADTVDAEDGFGWLLEEVPPDMIPNTISSQVIKDAAKRTLRDSGIDDSAADDFSNLIDELIGESITDFKIGYIQGENVVAVRRNGKRTLYQVHDKNLLAALTGLRPEQFGTITKAFGKVTKVFKALTTGSNAVWSIVSNAPRDFDSAYKYGSENNPIKYTVDYIKAVASQFGKNDTETMKLYRTLGGGYNNSFANAGELQLTLREMLPRDKNFAERVKGLFNIVNNVTKLADFVETAPRLAEFKRVYERTGDAKKAMLAAEEVTVNFNRSGKFTKTLDQYIPYLNASLQANAKYAKTIAQSFSKDGDKSFLVKSIVTAIIKTGLTFGILALFGDEGEEEYEKLSAYKKNNFYNIYLGNGKFLSIPKSQATGVFDSLLERVFEIARKEDVEWGQEVKDFAGYMWLTFGPPLVDDMIIGSTVLDLAKNENFTGAPIVPSYYEDLVPEMQYNEKTTYIAKSIGQLFGWSPMKIDHIIESNFGVFGLINKSLGRAEKDWTLGTKTKVITDNAYSTDILNNFYDKADDYATKAKSYPDNAEYVYKDKQYTAIKSIVSALNDYGKEDPELAREYKILARDYVDRFEKETKTNKKLCELLEATGNDDILYDKTFKPTYSINKVEYKMTSEEFMEMIDTYYEEVEKEYEDILKMKLSDDSTVRMLIGAKEKIYNRVAKDYKKKR